MLNTLHEAIAIVEALPESRACAKCDYFEGKRCKQWIAVVPSDAQAAGCEKFEDRVPF